MKMNAEVCLMKRIRVWWVAHKLQTQLSNKITKESKAFSAGEFITEGFRLCCIDVAREKESIGERANVQEKCNNRQPSQ